jgi:hypothetical protein
MQVLYPPGSEAAAEAVARAMERWLERAVIGLNLCPFARAPYAKRQIRFAVTGATTADELLAELEHELQGLVAADPARCETTLLIHPHAMTDFLDFHFFQAEAQALLERLELSGTLQLALFHPQFEFAGSAADDIANYTNRAPFPVLHLLREASIETALRSVPEAAGIYERNIQTLQALGHAGWRRLWSEE